MNSTLWFLLHLGINLGFFSLFFLFGKIAESFDTSLMYQSDWLEMKEWITKVSYLIFWTGVQIANLVYKRYEKLLMYVMFAVLAFAVALSI